MVAIGLQHSQVARFSILVVVELVVADSQVEAQHDHLQICALLKLAVQLNCLLVGAGEVFAGCSGQQHLGLVTTYSLQQL